MNPPSQEAIFRVINAGRITQTLRAAVDVGVVRGLAGRPADLATLSVDTGVTVERLRYLMDALQAAEMIERAPDGRYSLRAPPVIFEKMFRPRDLRGALHGRPLFAGHTPQGADQAYPDVVDGLAHMLREPARLAAERMAGPGLRVLEVAAGACPWSLALAEACPDATFVINDLPSVLTRSRRAVDRAGQGHRYRTLPGDLFTTELGPRRFDRILVPMVLHLFDVPTAARFVERAATVLAPGGQLVLIDAFLPTADTLDLDAALYSLELLTRSAGGRVHTLGDAFAWLAAAGLSNPRVEIVPGRARVGLVTGELAPAEVG